MTALLGGSMLLIAASAAALVYGWLDGDDTFIWGSIAATVGAALLVGIAYWRSARQPAVVTGEGEAPGPGDEATQVQPQAGPPPAEAAGTPAPQAGPGVPPETTAGPAPEEVGVPASEAGPGGAAEAMTAATAGAEAGAPEGEAATDVVAVPRTKKFHRTDCRFASAQGGERMSRDEAEAKDFTPCGVCKP